MAFSSNNGGGRLGDEMESTINFVAAQLAGLQGEYTADGHSFFNRGLGSFAFDRNGPVESCNISVTSSNTIGSGRNRSDAFNGNTGGFIQNWNGFSAMASINQVRDRNSLCHDGSIGGFYEVDGNNNNAFARYTDTPRSNVSWPVIYKAPKSNGGRGGNNCNNDSGYETAFYDSPMSRRKNSEISISASEPPTVALSKREMNDWRRVLKPPRPGFGYVCRICSKGDHYVENCPSAPPRHAIKTPYQGHNACFGMFHCERCDRDWGSHNSRAEIGEFCRGCQRMIYPHKQFPLDKIPETQLQQLKKKKYLRRQYH